MMHEIKHVRQIPNEGFRRWFADDYFDLFVWYDDDKEVVGFQLCYGEMETDHALTWRRDSGYSHEGVDAGEDSASINRTPILVADGVFPRNAVLEEFERRNAEIDVEVSRLVIEKLRNY